MSDKTKELNFLRAEAEAQLIREPMTDARGVSTAELLHELQVHQVELEMQNEELRQAQVSQEEALARYMDLYDVAPVGYFTLTGNTEIVSVNLTGAAMLGVERKKLIRSRFASFIAPHDSDRLHLCLKSMVQHGDKQSCELAIKRGDGSLFHARLDCLQTKFGNKFSIRIALADITEYKQAENVIKKSREQLEAFIRHAPISIAMFDRNMNYLSTSGRWLMEYGRGYNDLIGRNHYDVHPDMPAKWRSAHQQGLAGITLKNNEDIWLQADGSKHWLRWTVQPWNDEKGGVGGVIISTEDITEYKKQEWLLKQKSFALNRVKESVYLIDEEGYFQYVNDEVSRLLGYTREELLDGMGVLDISPRWTKEKWKEHWQNIKSRGSITFESSQYAKDGRIFPVEVNANYFEFDGCCFTMGLVRDLTERNQTEAQLRKLVQAVEQSPESILITNLNAEIEYVNDAFVKRSGYSREEVIGKNPRILQSGKTPPEIFESLWDTLTHGRMWEGEFHNRRKDGSEYTEFAIISPIRQSDGHISHYTAVKEDITERKRIENVLLQTSRQLRELVAKFESSQEAERKSIAREVHDELGQTLSTLRLDISMIRTRFGKNNPELMALAENMTELVDHAIHGVRNVSENLRPAVMGMGIYAAIDWLCSNFAARTGIPCVLGSPDPCVDMEETRAVVIFRIVQESLTNVMRHAHARNVNIVISRNDEYLCVEVKDDGRGFDMNNSKQQASFGLLGMRERARAWGGHLDIASTQDKGTVISFCIPIIGTGENK